MIIDVSDLMKKKKLKQEIHLEIGESDILHDIDDAELIDSIKLDGVINNIGDILNLNGNLSTVLRLTCSRCLEKFTYPVDSEVHEKFSKNVDDNDEDIILIEDDSLDLTEVLENNIEAALPMKKLCSEECKGLCPSCGTNMNSQSCNCDNPDVDIRLAKLKDLFR